jgi:HlyD family secretion protein
MDGGVSSARIEIPAARSNFELGGRQKMVGVRSVLAVLVLGVGGTVFAVSRWREEARDRFHKLAVVSVQRGDLVISITAPGWVDCTEKTKVVCELQNISSAGGRGGGFGGGGGATILALVSEGKYVHKGDVLCELDSSSYAESVRQTQIEVDAARAALVKAELDVRAAEIGKTLYIEGTHYQTEQNYRGQMALSESDFQRQTSRMAWTDTMKSLGYLSTSQVTSEQLTLKRAELSLGSVKRSFDIFQTYSDKIQQRRLEGQLEGLRAMLDYNRIRLQKSEERLEKFKQQVANCTIRAPRDGFLMYANSRRGRGIGNEVVELGAQVRQRQELFHLPNLEKLEVQTLLHESIVDRVREKSPVRMHIEVFPDATLEGKMGVISPLPLPVDQNLDRSTQPDTRNFLAKIPVKSVPPGTKPGMSVEVEILSAVREKVLLVPIKSVVFRDGRGHCYLKRSDRVERREIEIGQMNRQFLEVTKGLSESETIVLDPTQVDASMLVAQSESALTSLSTFWTRAGD